MSVSITVDAVLSDGRIDQAATEAAFHSALLRTVAEVETQEAEIASQVSAIFDQFTGKAIGMPALGSMVAQRLNAQPENFKTLSDRALDYVRANSQETGSEKDGTLAQHPDSEYVIAKGKNGGCYRRADRPAKPAK
jgi:regulator of sirC expression with transglutaminase-like and TPR domain